MRIIPSATKRLYLPLKMSYVITLNIFIIYVEKCINKVRDHCKETGKHRRPACIIFNLRYKQENFIPVIMQNGSGYDFNLL